MYNILLVWVTLFSVVLNSRYRYRLTFQNKECIYCFATLRCIWLWEAVVCIDNIQTDIFWRITSRSNILSQEVTTDNCSKPNTEGGESEIRIMVTVSEKTTWWLALKNQPSLKATTVCHLVSQYVGNCVINVLNIVVSSRHLVKALVSF